MKPTAEQQTIIDSPARRIACQAVPGSGKTNTMAARICRMVEDGTILTGETAIVTLTNAAADEIQERLIQAGRRADDFGFIGTIHGLALRTIRYHGQEVTVMSEQLSDRLLDLTIANMALRTTRSKIRRAFWSDLESSDDQIGASAYRARLEDLNAIEVDYLIEQATRILSAAGDAAWRSRKDGFTALFVDEFQDTSPADLAFFEALDPRYFFVIGDQNQSIFGFRGADPENTRMFLKGPGSTSFRMAQTFRCSFRIAEAASLLLKPPMIPAITPNRDPRKNPGPKLFGIKFDTPAAEIQVILQMSSPGRRPDGSIAILCRYTRQVTAISSVFKASGLIVATAALAPPGHRQAIAAAQLLGNQDNNELALLEYESAFGLHSAGLTVPPGSPGSHDIQAVYQFLLKTRVPEESAAWFCRHGKKAGGLGAGIELARFELRESPIPPGDRGITITTIHGAKGREWDHVLIPAMEELTIPGPNASQDRVAEERRIFYVAMTRARFSVVCTFCEVRDRQFTGAMESTAPSRFLGESGIL